MNWSDRITVRLVKMPKRPLDAATICTVVIDGVGTLHDVKIYRARGGEWKVLPPYQVNLDTDLAIAIRVATLKCWYDNLPVECRLLVE